MKQPIICYESRDLGYTREYNASQRRLTFTLSTLLAGLLTLLYFTIKDQ